MKSSLFPSSMDFHLPKFESFTEQCHLGPLINPMQANKVTALINDSVSMGAKVLTGGSTDGQLFRPTVVADVTAEMPLFKEEIFGPVAPIITFKTEQEAISLANASSLGLSASIHTGNSARGEYLAGLIHAGMVHVNDQTVNNEYHIPFGGLKDSGDAGRRRPALSPRPCPPGRTPQRHRRRRRSR